MKKILLDIQKRAYDFFKDFTNYDLDSEGYGLTSDHSNNLERSSIASVGFTLSSYVIGVAYQYLSFEEAKQKTINTLKTLLKLEHFCGFFSHFIETKTGKRYAKSEFSTIDTALLLNGIITVDSYFKDDEITKLAKMIITRVDFEKLVHVRNNKLCYYMAYNNIKDGDYSNGNAGYIHHWSMFAEQLMMYVIHAGLDESELPYQLYKGFERNLGQYKKIKYLYSPGNTLFNYQFPLAWLDLKGYYDDDNISWFNNAKNAILGHQRLAIDLKKEYRTFNKYCFGFNASDTKTGYQVLEAIPNVKNKVRTDGTVAPFGIVGSLIFTPKLAKKSIRYLLKQENLYGKYGFYDAFNNENEKWISNRYIAINKGLEMLMVNAYLTKDVMNAYMNHSLIKEGLTRLNIKKKERE